MKERTICAVWVVLGGVVGEGGFGLKIWVGGGVTLGGAEMRRRFGD